jgi:hypothetical protein
MTATGELFAALISADGKTLPPSAFTAAITTGELAVPTLTADGKTVLMTVTPCANAEKGFPVLTADGKTVLVQGRNVVILLNGGYLEAGETWSSGTHSSFDLDSPWVDPLDVPLVFPQEAPYICTNIGMWMAGRPDTAIASAHIGIQLKYEDDSLSNRFALSLLTDPQVSKINDGVAGDHCGASSHWNNRVVAYLEARSEAEAEKKVKSWRMNAQAGFTIGASDWPFPGYLYFRARLDLIYKAL